MNVWDFDSCFHHRVPPLGHWPSVAASPAKRGFIAEPVHSCQCLPIICLLTQICGSD